MKVCLRRYYFLFSLLVLFPLSVCAESFRFPNFDAGYFQFYGRMKVDEQGYPYMTWPGSSIEGRFSGTSLSVVIKDDMGKNYFNVIVDGEHDDPFIIEARPGIHEYLVADALFTGEHHFQLYKRTEGWEGGAWFYGVRLAEKGRMLDPPPRPKRKIVFYGDSITSGMGNEAKLGASDNVLSEKNNYLSYAAITARNLSAEQHIISLSGIGILISWFDFTMPEYFNQLTGERKNTSLWDFSLWQPDVVVINLMQNDSVLIDYKKTLNPAPTADEIISAYRRFVESLMEHHPNATFICALGSMDVAKLDRPWIGYMDEVVKQIRRVGKNKNKISRVILPFGGSGQHPRLVEHKINANILTAHIQKQMNW